MSDVLQGIRRHQEALQTCRLCADMQGPVVMGNPVVSPVLLVGQAPGNKQIEMERPFAWTAGKTLLDTAPTLVGRHPAWREIVGLSFNKYRALRWQERISC